MQSSHDWIATLMPYGFTRDIDVGNVIFTQDEDATHICLVISGRASARVYSEQGAETWVDYFSVDDFFGHASFFTQIPIDFEVRADTQVKVLFVPTQKLKSLLSSNVELSHRLAQDLASRLSIMISRLVEAVTLSSTGRVCAEIMRLAQPIGLNPNILIVRPTPVFVELASRINSTRETVSRTVSDLQKRGIVSREPGSLIIQKPQELKSKIR